MKPIPCLKDNYAYLLICEETQKAAVVDPSEASPVLETLKEHPVELIAILNTHHHFDHVGGNKKLVEHFPNLAVYGSLSDKGRIACQTHFLSDAERIEVGSLKITVIFNPGHTHGAISYHVDDKALFTGDTLFGAGCGRLFEGNATDMQNSFNTIFALRDDTMVYCGHEYTEANLRFAHHVDPTNKDIIARQKAVEGSTHKINQTVPFSLAEEKRTNPFARTHLLDIIEATSKHFGKNFDSDDEVFGALREWKDGFK